MDSNYLDITIGVDEVGRGSIAGPLFVCACFSLSGRSVSKIENITDSKKIKKIDREKIFNKILNSRDYIFCISFSTEEEIEKLNILQATLMAMKCAIEGCLAIINGNKINISKEYIPEEIFSFIEQNKNIQSSIFNRCMFFGSEEAQLELKKVHDKDGSLNIRNTDIMIDGNKTPLLNLDQNISLEAIVKGDSKVYMISVASIFAKVARDKIMQNILHKLFPFFGWDTNSGYGTKKHISGILQYGITKHHRVSFVNSILNKQNSAISNSKVSQSNLLFEMDKKINSSK